MRPSWMTYTLLLILLGRSLAGEEANETSLVQQEMMGGHSHGLYTFDQWSVHSEHGQQIPQNKQGRVTVPKLNMTNTWSL